MPCPASYQIAHFQLEHGSGYVPSGESVASAGCLASAHFGDRDHVDRFIVISVIGDHDRSGATLGAGG